VPVSGQPPPPQNLHLTTKRPQIDHTSSARKATRAKRHTSIDAKYGHARGLKDTPSPNRVVSQRSNRPRTRGSSRRTKVVFNRCPQCHGVDVCHGHNLGSRCCPTMSIAPLHHSCQSTLVWRRGPAVSKDASLPVPAPPVLVWLSGSSINVRVTKSITMPILFGNLEPFPVDVDITCAGWSDATGGQRCQSCLSDLVTSVEWRCSRRGECLHPPLRGLISPVLCNDGGTTRCPFCDVCARECIHSVNHVVWACSRGVRMQQLSYSLSPCSYASPIRWHSCCQAGGTCGSRAASSVTCRFAQETNQPTNQKKKHDYLTFRNAHVALVGATPTQCLQCISTVFVLFPDHWCIARGDLTCVLNVTSSCGLLRALRELEGLPWNAGSEQ
jgi:hypothetical protein